MQIPVLHLYMTPENLIVWLIIGLIAGSLATRIIGGHSYGCIGNIIVGLIGAVIGGYLGSLLNFGNYSFFGEIVTSFIGACILVAVLRFLFSSGKGK
jgi:uncharacterized membrane protein YeaQ/YmgE (transglycosylase-associated protein family)